MTTYDHAGHEVYAEQELSREELGEYYDRRGWPWRRDDDEKYERCVICHLTIRREEGGLCDAHKYDEQLPREPEETR